MYKVDVTPGRSADIDDMGSMSLADAHSSRDNTLPSLKYRESTN